MKISDIDLKEKIQQRERREAFVAVVNAGLKSKVMKRISREGIGNKEMTHALRLFCFLRGK